jgi:hypothetical protein
MERIKINHIVFNVSKNLSKDSKYILIDLYISIKFVTMTALNIFYTKIISNFSIILKNKFSVQNVY